jgi:predicted nucleotidyltransferase
MNNNLSKIPTNKIAEFCRRWKIRELSVFGSILTDNFNRESDVDIMIDFEADAEWSLLDHVRMQLEIQTILRRKVDLIGKRALEASHNWLLRKQILSNLQIIFPR